MVALLQRLVDFPTRDRRLSNSAPSPVLWVLDPSTLSPAERNQLIERAMRITVPGRV